MPEIVVGVDGSDNSLRALRWAADEAKLRGSALRVVHSWTFPDAVVGPDGRPHADIEGAANKVLDDAIATLGSDPGVEVIREIAGDIPAKALIRLSQQADLVVVGSRGRGGFAELLLGSVARQVTEHSTCPVVVIR